MSVIEDNRQIVQDFIAPELRVVSARLDALEKRYDSLNYKLDDVDQRAEKRHDELTGAMRQLVDYNSIQQRLAWLESRDTPHQ